MNDTVDPGNCSASEPFALRVIGDDLELLRDRAP